ncbi:MAG TPA: RNA 2',3'-cyclic phosphodiesterase, partial [Desulforhopalus sp.]|nr:RNA 2',3'-cyclic phosphodiesterase [Desulforhopalus sp.]
AIDPPAEIRQLLAGMGGSLPRSRPVPAEQLHLTLRFIGEVEGGLAQDIAARLSDIRHPALALCLRGVGTFSFRGEPSVLWAGVEPRVGLFSLRAAVEKELSDLGLRREKGRFSPHFTLARLKNCPARHLHPFLAGNALLRSEPFAVNSFQLYRSQLTTQGAQHQLLHSYPLSTRLARLTNSDQVSGP